MGFDSALELSLTLLAIEIVVGALLYMASKIIRSEVIEKLTREFLINVVITTLLVFVILEGFVGLITDFSRIAATSFLTSIPNPQLNIQGNDLIEINLAILRDVIFYCLLVFRDIVYQFYTAVYFVQGEVNYSGVSGTSTNPGIYGLFLQNIISNIINLEILYFLLFKLLQLFKYFVFPILFPLGVALRSLKPTRTIGAFFMAISLAFYIVFPFVYLTSLLFYPSNLVCFREQINFYTNPCQPFSPLTPSQREITGRALLFEMGENLITAQINSYLRDLFLLFCFFPLIAFALASTSANIGTTMLGGRIEEIGRGIVRFI